MNPSVSVVTPSYNQAQYLRDTIESVQSQTYEDIHHIVVDGGSDDGTIDLLYEFDDVEWVSEPDNGQAHAVNKGFERSGGDIVGWLNADDPYVYRRIVSRVVEQFEQTNADILIGHAITIDQNNTLRRAHYIPEFNQGKLRRHCYLIQPSIFFRKHVIKENQLNEEREYSMDYEYWLSLAGQYDFSWFDGIIAADRNHPQRKIIANAQDSAEDTAALREQRDIPIHSNQYKLMQVADSLDLRIRRARALPLLIKLLREPASRFAFDLKRPPLSTVLRSQLIGNKKKLY